MNWHTNRPADIDTHVDIARALATRVRISGAEQVSLVHVWPPLIVPSHIVEEAGGGERRRRDAVSEVAHYI
eukprot:scaffold93605_cov37-Tisochrysis_lutea.AAC.4